MKTLVVGSISYFKPFHRFGEVTTDVNQLESCDLVCFTGGADVDPGVYGSHVNSKTRYDTGRDLHDMDIFHRAMDAKKPMVGICRGSQFLCAMAGGKLVQHVERHAIGRTHKIETYDGLVVNVTSTHHQMQYPWGVKHKILAWAHGLSYTYEGTAAHDETDFPKEAYLDDGLVKEPEAVYYPEINALACQWHPEYMDDDAAGMVYFQDLVQGLMGGTL